jgi:hypothetical protein
VNIAAAFFDFVESGEVWADALVKLRTRRTASVNAKDLGFMVTDAGCWMLDTGYWMQC